jgi:glycosyltransferase involved in cell wall biosynthesis
LATFTAALRGAIAGVRGTSSGLGVVSLVDSQESQRSPEVVHEHLNGNPRSLERAIEALNAFDIAFVQHEYGIYGGSDGSEVVDLLAGLEIPAVVTLHTVLSKPSAGQKSILEEVVSRAERTIVMSDTAHRRLLDTYRVDPAAVRVVPHGARIGLGGPSLADGTRPMVLTWGLIGPGKGLEMAIDAFAGLRDLLPLPRYVILGKTHPKVEASQGNAYLEGLASRVHDLGLNDVVEFDDRYLDTDELALAVRRADMVVLPYESTEQVTSGVLVEAMAAGKPVVATAFPHAVELLATGAGTVVPHGDPISLTTALRSVLTQPSVAAAMALEAQRIGSTLQWPAIARRYHDLSMKLVPDPGVAQVLASAAPSQEVTDGLARAV